jgi:flagellar hook-basal body complex protein FliE
MNFLFRIQSSSTGKKKPADSDFADTMKEAVESYNNALNESAKQFNKTRRKAEEEIQRGASITKHRINL